MKIFMVMLAVMSLAACTQESNEQTTPAAAKVKPIEKEQVKINTTTVPVPADKVMKKEKPADTNIVPAPVKETTVKKERVKPKPAAKAKETKPVVTTVAKKTPEVAPAPSPKVKKVIAPRVQGKGPIKSEPSPAPSDIMLKSEPIMDMAKANALTKKCKSCHATNKDKVGPSWKKIQAAYGSADTLAAVFESGFAVENRRVVAFDVKWKKKAKTMTAQYKNLIKKQVGKGKFTYNALAAAIFAK
ncbi:hypothetical protein [Ghiorsea bivora]|uniref:hypothetical protein n=1 Tax=Ghiorsea bivora TaxID=1485545 RepID=UPI000692441F|nr:hypothetical protein [Ghiorsea bivora]